AEDNNMMNIRIAVVGLALLSLAAGLRQWTHPRGPMLFASVSAATLGGSNESASTYTDHARLLVYRDAENKEHPVNTREDWLKRGKHILAGQAQAMGAPPDLS